MLKQELRAVMIRNGDRQEDLAKALGISPTALSAKINGKRVFTQPEIEKIALRYNLTAQEIQRIFFTHTVAYKEDTSVQYEQDCVQA